MKKLLILSFILFFVSVHSQITLYFKDSISKAPSPFIMVFNEQQEIIGTSNELGKLSVGNRSKFTSKLFLESIFYEKKEISSDKLENNTIILLTPMVNLLDEVEINYKRKYKVLTAYYRVYNLSDDVLDSFVDAEVKYIIKKNSIERKVLNFRIFDTISTKKYKLITPYWVPNLKKTSLFEKLNSKFHLIKDKEKGFINIIGEKDSKLYGTIRAELNLKNKSNLIIGPLRWSKYFNNIYIEEYYNDELLKTTIEDLKYRGKISERNVTTDYIKQNPLLKGKEKLVHKNDMFIQSVKYISKEEYKKLMKKGYKDTSISHYTKEFWKNLETFTPLDPLVEKQLNEILIERK